MIRTLLCAVLALFLVSGLSLADKGNKRKNRPVHGKVEKFDAATGSLTLSAGKKGAKETKEFKVTDSASFEDVRGDTTKALSGKDGLKELRAGEHVAVTVDDAGKVTKVTIGRKKRQK